MLLKPAAVCHPPDCQAAAAAAAAAGAGTAAVTGTSKSLGHCRAVQPLISPAGRAFAATLSTLVACPGSAAAGGC
jgi:hypothetical protein